MIEAPKTPDSVMYTVEYFLDGCGGNVEYLKGKVCPRLLNDLEQINPKKDERILDLACGRGEIVAECSKKHAITIGIDYSLAVTKMTHKTGAPVIRASATHIPIIGNYFDKAGFFEVLEHLDRKNSNLALKELYRVCKQGGKIFISTQNYHPMVAAALRLGRRVGTLLIRKEKVWGVLHVDEKSYSEINRLLKKNGFYAVLAIERFSFNEDIRSVLAAKHTDPFKGAGWKLFCLFAYFCPQVASNISCIATKR